jgi:hypothetical protein
VGSRPPRGADRAEPRWRRGGAAGRAGALPVGAHPGRRRRARAPQPSGKDTLVAPTRARRRPSRRRSSGGRAPPSRPEARPAPRPRHSRNADSPRSCG